MLRPLLSRITAAGQPLTWANVHEIEKATVPADQAKERAGTGDLIARAVDSTSNVKPRLHHIFGLYLWFIPLPGRSSGKSAMAWGPAGPDTWNRR